MKPIEPHPVKLIIGVLYSDSELWERAREKMTDNYGPIDHQTKDFPFDSTHYYDPEMGSPIYRLFCGFQILINPGRLADIKIQCNDIEDALAVDNNRKINLDPGYLDYDKFVLASAKYKGHKIYLNQGIYADTTLHYAKGHYIPGEYCFPDFKSGIYENDFLSFRTLLKNALK